MITQGLRPIERNGTEFKMGAVFDLPPLEELPESFSFSPLSIKDQNADGNGDMCAACASSGMKELQEEEILYYPYLFAAAKYETDDNPDSWGLTLKQVGKALTVWGIPKLSDVPDAVLSLNPHERRRFENYPSELRQKAKEHKASTYFFVEGKYDPFDDVRASIWKFREQKQAVLHGVDFGWKETDITLEGTPQGYGHAMWICGWDKTHLLTVNSTGKDAGDKGIHRISRETFNTYASKYGTIMFVDMPRPVAEFLIEHHMKDGEETKDMEEFVGWIVTLFKKLSTLVKKLFGIL